MIWKAEGKPNLFFYPPASRTYFESPIFEDKVVVGNTQPDTLVSYKLEGNMLTIGEQTYTVVELKTSWLGKMVLEDNLGNTLTYNQA